MAEQYKCPKCGEGTMKIGTQTVELIQGGPNPPEAKFRCDKCGYEARFPEVKSSGSN